MAATRLVSKAAALKAAKATTSAPIAATIAAKAPKGFKAPALFTAPKAPTSGMIERLQAATYEALCGMNAARSKVASMVLVIRECQRAKMDAATMGAHMQLGVIMLGCKVDQAGAEKLLSAEKRTPEVLALLKSLKETKCRAMAVIKREDGPTPGKAPKAGKPSKPGKPGKGGKPQARLLDPINVPAPVNAAAFHAQLLKVRTLLATAAKQAAELATAEDKAAAEAALAALPSI